jgi:hypothetical protein
MKKAFLVDVTLRTRVIVDVPENWDENETTLDKIGLIACEKLTEQIRSNENPICLDNVGEIEEDYECPFGTFDE